MADKKKATGTALAIVDNNPSIPDVLLAIKEEIKNLDVVKTTTWKTNGTSESFKGIDLKTETSIPNLIKAYAIICAKEKAYNEAIDELGITEAPVWNDGGTKEEWKHDIQLRIKIVSIDSRHKQLKEFEAEANKFLSEEDQKTMLFAKMSTFLAGKS